MDSGVDSWGDFWGVHQERVYEDFVKKMLAQGQYRCVAEHFCQTSQSWSQLQVWNRVLRKELYTFQLDRLLRALPQLYCPILLACVVRRMEVVRKTVTTGTCSCSSKVNTLALAFVLTESRYYSTPDLLSHCSLLLRAKASLHVPIETRFRLLMPVLHLFVHTNHSNHSNHSNHGNHTNRSNHHREANTGKNRDKADEDDNTLTAVVKFLVSQGADINEREEGSWDTILHASVLYGDCELLSLLIELKADVFTTNERQQSAMDYALSSREFSRSSSSEQRRNCIRLILQNGGTWAVEDWAVQHLRVIYQPTVSACLRTAVVDRIPNVLCLLVAEYAADNWRSE